MNIDPLTPTIFHESWWLDIATGGRYEVAEVIKGGKVIGRQPIYFHPKKLLGVTVVGMPPLTHFLGPAIVDCQGKPSVKFSHRHAVTIELIKKLPNCASLSLKCHRNVTDVLAFQASGFNTRIQFTGEIHPQSIDALWGNLRDKTRTLIRRARKVYNLTIGVDPALFMHFYSESFYKVKGVPSTFDVKIHTKLIQTCLVNGRGKIFEVRDQNGVLTGALFCAWDHVSSYPLMFCRDPNAHWAVSGLLLWEAISDALNQNLIFDFDGFASDASARAANNFNAVIVPRYIVTRESSTMMFYRYLQSHYKDKSFFY